MSNNPTMNTERAVNTEHAGTTAQRIERKYPLPDEQLPQVIEAVNDVLPVYRYNGSTDWSSLRTTYLDTREHQCFKEHLQLLPVRKKIRIRQYGHSGKYEPLCWIELKIKDRNMRLKRRFRCTPEHAARLLQGEDIGRDIRAINTEQACSIYPVIHGMIQELGLRPVIRVDYDRLSFQNPEDPDVRVTVDREIQFRAATGNLSGQLNGMVLELKYNGQRPSWMSALRTQLEISRRRQYSKFARSMKKLDKLRQLEGHL